jgi:hypothetical protein
VFTLELGLQDPHAGQLGTLQDLRQGHDLAVMPQTLRMVVIAGGPDGPDTSKEDHTRYRDQRHEQPGQ